VGGSGTLLTAASLSLERAGRQLFDRLSFEVQSGQLVQLEGANGAGKTSLLRILAGLSRYGFDGRVRRSCPLLYLGHQPAVKGLLTPRENLAWHVSGAAHPGDLEIERALERVGLFGYEDVPSQMLSAGQHRRVNLARLFLSESPLWLLDEPFTAIDRHGVQELQALLQRHVEAGGAVLLTSHQPLQVACPLLRIDLQRGLLT
jgi:heme exporter protein A